MNTRHVLSYLLVERLDVVEDHVHLRWAGPMLAPPQGGAEAQLGFLHKSALADRIVVSI